MSGRERAWIVLVLIAAVLAVTTWMAARPDAPSQAAPPPGPWSPAVPPDRVLVANERDTGDDPDARRSEDWFVTSGSWFADEGAWWSGPIDGSRPDLLSRTSTGSAVLRVVSTRAFQDSIVAFDVEVEQLVSTRRTPPNEYDGVHLFLRYRDADNLYAVSILRRDGLMVVKKKMRSGTSAGGSPHDDGYTTLRTAQGTASVGERVHVEVAVRDVKQGVSIRVRVDGDLVLDVLDVGVDGRRPLLGPGRVGIRADNAQIRVWDFSVTSPQA